MIKENTKTGCSKITEKTVLFNESFFEISGCFPRESYTTYFSL